MEGLVDPIIAGAAASFVLIATAFGVLFSKLVSRDRVAPPSEDLDTICSPDRYQAIEQLAAAENHKTFFKDRNLESQLRKKRVAVLRSYLHQLSADFHQVTKAVQLMLVQSQVDRPDLARIVLKQRLVFFYAMMSMEVRLTMYGFGLNRIDERLLTGSMYAMRSQLQSLSAIAAPSAA
jgi:hypothetical protein